MENFKEEIRELVDELKTWQGAARGILLGFLYLSMISTGYLSYHEATVRHFNLLTFACALLFTFFLTLQYKKRLGDAKRAGKDRKSRMKLWSELFGAVAILSLLLSFYRMGVDLDRAAYKERIMHLDHAMAYIKRSRICVSNLSLKASCDRLESTLSTARQALNLADESKLEADVKQMKWDGGQVLVIGQAQWLRYWFDVEMDAALVEDDSRLFTIMLLPLTLLFACLTISRKIALAWFEWGESPGRARSASH